MTKDKNIFTYSSDRILPSNISNFMEENCTKKCQSTAYSYFTIDLKTKEFQTGAFEVKENQGKITVVLFHERHYITSWAIYLDRDTARRA